MLYDSYYNGSIYGMQEHMGNTIKSSELFRECEQQHRSFCHVLKSMFLRNSRRTAGIRQSKNCLIIRSSKGYPEGYCKDNIRKRKKQQRNLTGRSVKFKEGFDCIAPMSLSMTGLIVIVPAVARIMAAVIEPCPQRGAGDRGTADDG